MINKTFLVFLCALWGIFLNGLTAHPSKHAAGDSPVTELKLESLLSSPLAGVEGKEVIVSRVEIPPHTTLPKHWHAGEEFVYVLDGSVTLWQKGKKDIVFVAGEAGMVPLKQIHTAVTTDEGATLVVFVFTSKDSQSVFWVNDVSNLTHRCDDKVNFVFPLTSYTHEISNFKQ